MNDLNRCWALFLEALELHVSLRYDEVRAERQKRHEDAARIRAIKERVEKRMLRRIRRYESAHLASNGWIEKVA